MNLTNRFILFYCCALLAQAFDVFIMGNRFLGIGVQLLLVSIAFAAAWALTPRKV